jgi:hypothetical protein
VAVAAALASLTIVCVATPSADAQVPAAPCSYIQVPIGEANGNPGTAPIQVCQGIGLSFIGPTIGQIGTVIGPTTIGPAVIGVDGAAMGNIGAAPSFTP